MSDFDNKFVHLNVRTEYSLLESSCRIKQLVTRIKQLGQTAVAITDLGNLYGAVRFWEECKKQGIKPIIGCKVKVSRQYSLILLCRNQEGYGNLIKLVSESSADSRNFDKNFLRHHSGGLICLSDFSDGEISSLLLSDREDFAYKLAIEYSEIFGSENFFLEIQNHGSAEENELLKRLYRLSENTNIPLVATNDCRYIYRRDSEAYRVLRCIKDGRKLLEHSRDGFGCEGDEYYIKSYEEMKTLFHGHDNALENTFKIAEMCNFDFTFGKMMLPKYKVEEISESADNREYFGKLCYEGAKRRYGDSPNSEVIGRLEHEISVIISMGFTDYFLIVRDFVGYAKKNGIPVGAGRGSGAGSLCAYCLGITEIDPIKYNLLFERFLNPERVSMPDFDIDFCIRGRQRVKDYVTEKYGRDRVCEIIAFDTMKARASVRDVGRVMDIPYVICDRVAKLIDRSDSLSESLENSPELANMYKSDVTVRKLIDTAIMIEGMPHHTTVHPAGLVISPIPLESVIPIQKTDGTVVTHYTAEYLERLGLLKIDFLGLRNLTIIDDAVKEIRKIQPDFDICKIPLSDRGVYKMLSDGRTAGVFQFESAGITQKLREIRPENLNDLFVTLSLYRPGPMKSIPVYIRNRRNPEKIEYLHPMLKDILSETYGVMVYQEQVMEICRKVAGYTYGHADKVRKAMSKKKQDELLKERESFIGGAVSNGMDRGTAEKLFSQMESFGLYAFNKSHAVAYSHIAYQTAYLKYHYRGIYMSAVMSSVIQFTDKLAEYINICREEGLEIVRPDINISEREFVFRNGKIYFGLLAVKNTGDTFDRKIISERERNGVFRNLQDFCKRMCTGELNRRAVESLIKAGAFDGLGLNRRQMLESCESIIKSACADGRNFIEGQMNFFDVSGMDGESDIKIPPLPEYDIKKLLSMQTEATGVYFGNNINSSNSSDNKYLYRIIKTDNAEKFVRNPESIGDNLTLCLKTASCDSRLPEFERICRKYNGRTPVCIYFTDLRKKVRPRGGLFTEICRELCFELAEIFGWENIGLIN